MKTTRNADHVKANGIHYTPQDLATFLAEAVIRNLPPVSGEIHILDPACGSGALLQAIAMTAKPSLRHRIVLTGYEKDSSAITQARANLENCGVSEVDIKQADFLSLPHDKQRLLGFDDNEPMRLFDGVIANPPYVRTQVLGAKAAQALAKRFGLSGRVDLYQAFAFAMGRVLRQGGVLGLLTSNRLMTTNAGETLRKLLRTEFSVRELYDLGDTRLFAAAVLPAIVVAVKGSGQNSNACHFARAYESRNGAPSHCKQRHILNAMADKESHGLIETPQGVFLVEKGTLAPAGNPGDKWSLSTPEYDDWLSTLRENQRGVFENIASVRVGIKTTADKVFVRSDWDSLAVTPERELLHPLLTHREAARWCASWGKVAKRVLYPYDMSSSRKTPFPLEKFRRARAYLEEHESQLRGRKYVIEAGREWYEIWVSHVPSDWNKPKIVFPDISEQPKFLLDRSGAIVQGDCYWITLDEGVDVNWLLVMLAVANSTLGERYYDIVFHNKLYAGRRRFMTQYVKNFPLPKLDEGELREFGKVVEDLIQRNGDEIALEEELDNLVWRAFGLVKEVVG